MSAVNEEATLEIDRAGGVRNGDSIDCSCSWPVVRDSCCDRYPSPPRPIAAA